MLTLTLEELELNAVMAALDDRVSAEYRKLLNLKEQRDSPDNRFAIECAEAAIRYAIRAQIAISEAIDEPEFPPDMTMALLDVSERWHFDIDR